MFRIPLIITALLLSACAPRAEKKVEIPRVISMPKPTYPIYAFTNRLSGFVKFEYDVDAEGKVNGMRIVESVPDHLFDDAVINAAAKWRFEKNRPTKNIPVTVYFKFNQAEPSLFGHGT